MMSASCRCWVNECGSGVGTRVVVVFVELTPRRLTAVVEGGEWQRSFTGYTTPVGQICVMVVVSGGLRVTSSHCRTVVWAVVVHGGVVGRIVLCMVMVVVSVREGLLLMVVEMRGVLGHCPCRIAQPTR